MSLIPLKNKIVKSSIGPYSLIEGLQDELNRFFDAPLTHFARDSDQAYTAWMPSTDVHDLGDKIVVKTDMPGMDKDDIEITVQGSTLYIKGEKKQEEKVQDHGCVRSERYFGRFERALPLGEEIDSSKVDATYKDGVLTVNITKKEESKPKQIKVNVK